MKNYDFTELLEYYSGEPDWVKIKDIDDDGGRDHYFYAPDDFEAYIKLDGETLTVVINGHTEFEGKITDDPVRLYINEVV